MKGALKLFWLEGRSSLLAVSLLAFLLGWLLTAPIAPMSTAILIFVDSQPLLQKLLSAMMGIELQGRFTMRLLIGGTWSHPFVFALLWGYVMVGCSRFPTQFLENGNIDWLLSQPVSRRSVLIAQSLNVLLGVTLLLSSLTCGFALGCASLGEDRPTPYELVLVGLSLGFTCIFLIGLTSCIACFSSRRMRVFSVVSGLSLWCLLLAYLKPFLTVADRLSPLGLLHYFRPGEILTTGGLDGYSNLALLGGGFVLWVMADRVLAHRDIR